MNIALTPRKKVDFCHKMYFTQSSVLVAFLLQYWKVGVPFEQFLGLPTECS